jgi:peptidoglycan/xylan/chitin deacetylase (PgdA/CDA1 family)
MLAKYGLSKSVISDIQLFFQSGHRQRVALLRRIAKEFKKYSAEERFKVISDLAKIYNVCIQDSNATRIMLSWDEIREMDKYDISFGSHTVSHPVLSDICSNDILQEVIESKKIIEEKIQKSVTTFAYPYGKVEDYNDEVIRLLKDTGFEICCTTVPGAESLPLQNPLTLRRKGVPPSPYLFI